MRLTQPPGNGETTESDHTKSDHNHMQPEAIRSDRGISRFPAAGQYVSPRARFDFQANAVSSYYFALAVAMSSGLLAFTPQHGQ